MNAVTLRQLQYFVAAAEAGTVSAAAERCLASQAAVSTGLGELERALGLQLLVRRPAKGVALTRSGERMLPVARRILDDTSELERLAGAEHDEVAGPLRIACTVALSPRLLPPLAATFTERHPRVELDLVDGLASEVQDLLRTGAVDAAVLYRRQLAADFDVREVRSLAPYAVLPESHRLASAPDVSLAELAEERLILVQPAGSRSVIESLIEEAGIVPNPGWAFTNPETVRAMVARGLGYSVFSGRPRGTQSFDGRHVAYVRVRDAVAPNDVILAMPHGQRRTARLDALLALLGEPELHDALG
ncbi:LysR substrate-binding domain-containing protein [Agromyces soli]|uniref:LysR substrate-binding domain-containing protein n=1 Tax=Agromyces soli TaxID=659012 RepID=A0ABY4AX29_9MICO|nr:LysR substrate-binding domain-containing protein [Agromyces soli]UOE26346.1 LysR substrate-binding domain-containing protein [Agromyces soli]